MLNDQQSTLPFRVGDRVANRHGETGNIEEVDRNRLRISLDQGEIIFTSVFDVSLVAPAPLSLGRVNWRPKKPR